LAFEKSGGLSSGFLKDSRVYKGTFQKWGEVCTQLLKKSTLHMNLNLE